MPAATFYDQAGITTAHEAYRLRADHVATCPERPAPPTPALPPPPIRPV
ncbi:MAG: hypothetical protein AB7H92_19405 [Microbacteriaceae bacterium]